jgi:hypothetical protein
MLPVTPRPYEPRRMRFERCVIGLLLSDRSRSVAALRIELSALWLSAGAGQPALDYRAVISSSYGNRTHLSALKERNPEPIDERAVLLYARRQRAQWAGRRSNPRLRLFRPLLDRLSYRPDYHRTRKKPDVAVTPGFEWLRSGSGPSVNSAADARADSPVNRRCYLGIAVCVWNSTKSTT